MKRREFVAGLCGAAAWPLAARAQRSGRIRRIGILSAFAETDPTNAALVGDNLEALSHLGWDNGRNVRIDQRWAGGDASRMQILAKELIELQPDLIIGITTPATAALQRETRTIPIVFLTVSDPVGSGFVASLPRPGGNITGFINIEASMASKWLALIKEIAPGVDRAAVMFNPDTAPGRGEYYLTSFQSAAKSLAIEPITAHVRSDADIEQVITSLGREPGGGLVITSDSFMTVHRATVIALTIQHKVPVIFDVASFAKEGGLLQYGPSYPELFRRAASYVDRILRGEKPGDLPVEVPTKFELVVNLKTARALGLAVPNTLLVAADEVIE
jgi:putative ABC transport system substrate-binding protein